MFADSADEKLLFELWPTMAVIRSTQETEIAIIRGAALGPRYNLIELTVFDSECRGETREARTLQPLDNPFGPRVSPMS